MRQSGKDFVEVVGTRQAYTAQVVDGEQTDKPAIGAVVLRLKNIAGVQQCRPMYGNWTNRIGKVISS